MGPSYPIMAGGGREGSISTSEQPDEVKYLLIREVKMEPKP